MRKPSHSAIRGFTLIELLISLSIMMIIGTYGSIFFSRFVTTNALSNAQDQIVGQARKAQWYAMLGKQNGPWGIRYGTNVLTLFQGTSYATRNATYDETASLNTNVSVSGLTEIIFAKRTGLPSTGASSILLSTPIGTKTITMNAYGVVSR